MKKLPEQKIASRAGAQLGGETQIIGFRLPKDLAREVKVEATQRGISLKKLFAELWDQYKNLQKS